MITHFSDIISRRLDKNQLTGETLHILITRVCCATYNCQLEGISKQFVLTLSL
jgi:hypothetical protein